MAPANLKVYLDHHIPRDNLLYRRPETQEMPKAGDEHYLKIEHLFPGEYSRAELLRKPDFQRATWAWTPDDCVSLLESLLNEQVVPSVILWLNPESLWYVLDGGHRISVLLAWINNDWGDRRPLGDYRDKTLEKASRAAGARVRELLAQRQIGPFEEYMKASRRYRNLRASGSDPDQIMAADELHYAKLVRRWQSINMGFPILWVRGDYEKAEESFLKINKSGRQLSPWETTLVENRRSSFARAVMSIARVSDKNHCWPTTSGDVKSDPNTRKNLEEILKTVDVLHTLLLTPVYEKPITQPQQPMLATPYTRPELQPAYLAELLTITEGQKGQGPETRKLLQRDARHSVPLMIAQGERLLANARDVIEHLTGRSPRSLGLVPLVYFYNSSGTFVRSLLYGMVYWINRGSASQILARKRLFAAYRGAFERVLLANKDKIINRITRRIGSGPEVTYPTALYYDGLLRLLVDHDGIDNTTEFVRAHESLIENLSIVDEGDTQPTAASTLARTYRGQARQAVIVRDFIAQFSICSICGGRFYSGSATQVDHIHEHASGGPTTLENARQTHPFCNNQRSEVEAIKEHREKVELPSFEDPRKLRREEQVSFLSFIEEPDVEEPGDTPTDEDLDMNEVAGSDESEAD